MVKSGRREERRAPDISRGAKIALLLALLYRLDPEERRGERRVAICFDWASQPCMRRVDHYDGPFSTRGASRCIIVGHSRYM